MLTKLSIMTLSITIRKCETQHNNILRLCTVSYAHETQHNNIQCLGSVLYADETQQDTQHNDFHLLNIIMLSLVRSVFAAVINSVS